MTKYVVHYGGQAVILLGAQVIAISPEGYVNFLETINGDGAEKVGMFINISLPIN